MLYHLFTYLDQATEIPGLGLWKFISFRAALAALLSLGVSMVFGKKLINWLRYKQVGETVRDLGLEGQMKKQGTPTMGGLIILGAILGPALLLADLSNTYVRILIIATIWLGAIGFIDDYIKVFRKNKEGLAGRFKIVGQVGVGLIVSTMLYFSPDVTTKEKVAPGTYNDATGIYENNQEAESGSRWQEVKSMKTTIPFVKNNEFDYAWLVSWLPGNTKWWMWAVFSLIVIFIVTAVSNGANMTDGLDGLATGTSAIIGVTLAILAYVSGNYVFADYLNIMYIPESGELVVFIAAFVGACIGFLWFNSYPAQVFMGDTGSLALGGIIAVFAIAIRKELLIPVLCGIFLIENLSVMLQVSYFKYTKKRFGEGRRIFLMSPLHHHYQKKGMHEAKIVSRFWIVGILLAILTIVTLKIR